MKNYAKLVGNQLLFNVPSDYIKDGDKSVEQKGNDTVDRFEKKYGVRVEWRKETAKKDDGSSYEFEGWFLV